MGVALPAAIGAAIPRPGTPVFCVVGDGGMRAYPAEIKLAIQEKLPVCFIFITDGRYGSVACALKSGKVSQRAVTVFQPSWLKPMEAMGCEAWAANSMESFAAAVQDWDQRNPLFIEAVFDPNAYVGMTQYLR
jgi:thiamine pyrophosphate-dependent acetolactate synthase large subunit-like protein